MYDHGIARYAGVTQRTFGTDVKEYLQLDFAGTDKIFLPADQIGRITRYSGGPAPALSKLGGTEWERTKRRVRRAVGDIEADVVARRHRAHRSHRQAGVGRLARPAPTHHPAAGYRHLLRKIYPRPAHRSTRSRNNIPES